MSSKRSRRLNQNKRAAFPQRARQELTMSKKQAGRRVRKQRRKWQQTLRVNWDELAGDIGARQRVTRAPVPRHDDAPDDARRRVRSYGNVRATSTPTGASSAVRMPTGSVHESSTASSSAMSASLGRGR